MSILLDKIKCVIHIHTEECGKRSKSGKVYGILLNECGEIDSLIPFGEGEDVYDETIKVLERLELKKLSGINQHIPSRYVTSRSGLSDYSIIGTTFMEGDINFAMLLKKYNL